MATDAPAAQLEKGGADQEASIAAAAKASQGKRAESTGWEDENVKRAVTDMGAEEVGRAEGGERCAGEKMRWEATGTVGIKVDAEAVPTVRGNEAKMSTYDAYIHVKDGPLAELRSLGGPTRIPETDYNERDQDKEDIRRMLAEFDRRASSLCTTAVADNGNDPRSMLAEVIALSGEGPRRAISPTKDNSDGEEDEDISILRARLHDLRSSQSGSPPLLPAYTDSDRGIGHDEQAKVEPPTTAHLDPEAIPYRIALALEHSNCPWELAQAWTTSLYSSDPHSYAAQQAKELAVARAEETLNKTIASVMQAEANLRRNAEATKLQRRLIVSNLAAGADKKEIERTFRHHRADIVDITFLPHRDPLKRTQTAHINMAIRKAAVHASYVTGQVYGLIFNVRLAVERGGQS